MNRFLARLTRFRSQLIILWHAFFDKRTPLYLKFIMVAVVAYVVSPIDFLPDVFAVFGWIDDALLLAFAVNWIMSRLPNEVSQNHQNPKQAGADQRFEFEDDSTVIDGKSRRQ